MQDDRELLNGGALLGRGPGVPAGGGEPAPDALLAEPGQPIGLDGRQRRLRPQLDVDDRAGLQIAAGRRGQAEALDQSGQRVALVQPLFDVLRSDDGPRMLLGRPPVRSSPSSGPGAGAVMSTATQVPG
ncbi:hypothetical protein ACF082_11765 [Streptomyces lydicus]|uniref:hypothetical protein n=1 Tax=Streptomyces lydicus TaxID=47763 RepID=UPI002E2F6BA8|nr:hypothetical protein [Streptomyces lydicus]